MKPLCPRLLRPDFVPIEQRVLASGCVAYVGEPIAAVIAASAAEAEDIAEAVAVDIDPETPVVTLDRPWPPARRWSMASPATTRWSTGLDIGNVAGGSRLAAEIVEFTFVSRRQSAMPLEARAALASFDPSTGRVTLSISAQAPHMVRTGVADALGMPEAELRVIAPDVGGGFGQKMPTIPEHIIAVWAARRFRCAVAWIEDRLENLTASFHSRDQRLALRSAFAADGRLLAIDADILCNIGAYGNVPITAAVEPLMAMTELPGPYDLRAYKVRARGITTNTCPMAPYRGVSRPVITTAMERLMDTAAERLGLDPLEVRRRNLISSFPHHSVTGMVQDAGSYREAMEDAAVVVDLPAFRIRQEAACAQGRYLGIGFSVFAERTGYGTPTFSARKMEVTPGWERVELLMDPSGFVEARIGASPHGQGLKTTLAQLLADEIGVTPDQVRVISGDTDRTPYGWGTFASRAAVLAGGACKLAGIKLRERLAEVAAQTLEAAVSDIEISDGRAIVRGTDLGVEISRLARAAHHESHRFPAIMETGHLGRGDLRPGRHILQRLPRCDRRGRHRNGRRQDRAVRRR